MQFNVPQFIDIEDKIVGPLTAKQMGWLGLCGAILLVLWSFLDFEAFLLGAIIVAPIFAALAFYRPYNQPLIKFIISSLTFSFRPKTYIWKRLPEHITPIAKTIRPTELPKTRKTLQEDKLREISKLLDRKSNIH